MMNITEPFLPPIESYVKQLARIWKTKYLTNNGPVLRQLETGVEEIICWQWEDRVQIALKALAVSGEVITTPLSYVATTSALAWENCHPVFVDIDPDSFNMNPDLIDESITENTEAIWTLRRTRFWGQYRGEFYSRLSGQAT